MGGWAPQVFIVHPAPPLPFPSLSPEERGSTGSVRPSASFILGVEDRISPFFVPLIQLQWLEMDPE